VKPTLLIYGAYGYTGQLTARLAVERGLKPVLAGRDATKLEALAGRLGLESQAFDLHDHGAVDRALSGVGAVLHCAGPFGHTYRQMAAGCLRTSTHYLDISGEIAVYDGLHKMDAEARDSGVMLLPGIGFDVVPTDCLAARLKRRMPAASHLVIAIGSVGAARVSRGTTRTFIEALGRHGAVRKDGVLTAVPHLSKSRVIDFGEGPAKVSQVMVADLFSAYHSTGIPNIETYVAFPRVVRTILKMIRHFRPVLSRRSVQSMIGRLIDILPPGPTDEERNRTRTQVWAEVKDEDGSVAISRASLPEAYTFTALASLAALERVLQGDAPIGYQTPSSAFGPAFVLDVEGVTAEDVGNPVKAAHLD